MNYYIFIFIRGASELSATALMILAGCMGGAVSKGGENAPMVAGLHYGMVVMLVMHVFGFVSGAHANPCVSISCYFMGYIASKLMLMYVVCQLLGAALGYYLLMELLPQEVVDPSHRAVCLPEPMSSLTTTLQIVGIECLLTSVYVLGWCALWDVRNGRFLDSVSLRMGILVTGCSFAGVQLTEASMNPIQTLELSLVQGNPGLIGMQLTGQILASIVVPLVWQKAYMPRHRPLESPKKTLRLIGALKETKRGGEQ